MENEDVDKVPTERKLIGVKSIFKFSDNGQPASAIFHGYEVENGQLLVRYSKPNSSDSEDLTMDISKMAQKVSEAGEEAKFSFEIKGKDGTVDIGWEYGTTFDEGGKRIIVLARPLDDSGSTPRDQYEYINISPDALDSIASISSKN